MRLFTGMDLPEPTVEALESLIQNLSPHALLKWSPAGNLHITTHFIGEWPESRLDELNSALRAMPKRTSFPVAIHGLGWFPNPHQPRLLFAGVEAGRQELGDLADATRKALGAARETRPYSPHVTLARVGAAASLQGVRQAIAALPTTDFGSFSARYFYLYLSAPGPAGATYTKLTQFPLAA